MRQICFSFFLLLGILTCRAVGASGMYQCSVELTGYISPETGKAPNAYLWIPEGCKHVKAVVFAQQNMTEEMIFKMPLFQQKMKELDMALLWVAPAFTNSWDPASGCQKIFDEMMVGLAGQSGHNEIATAPIIPMGHSAQATMPWNFAAWNAERTLCVISFHGDAPRTNLCGYGTANVEWGRKRNIDGIPSLMIEGEYEWWEARVRPALAFRMFYPESCVSFLCDTGSGHFECSEETAEYIALFIQKAMRTRWAEDGKLRKVNPVDGWLACRYNADSQPNDGDGAKDDIFYVEKRPQPAPYNEYKGDKHDAFWYFDKEMALLTEKRYAEAWGKKQQYVGVEFEGKFVPFDSLKQGGMQLVLANTALGDTFRLHSVYTDQSHAKRSDNHGAGRTYTQVICGPAKKISDDTFQIVPYEAGRDNPRRSNSIWIIAVGEGDRQYKRAVQPIQIILK